MGKHDIVVVGASSGGVEALSGLAANLPRDLQAAIFIACHTAPHARSVLPAVLARAGPLPVAHAVQGELIHHGRIYVAPPDHHMLLEDCRVRLTRGPKENRFRPAVDALFRSAAHAYGPRVVGVVLSGALDDGTAGLWAIKDRGGKAIVQDPAQARHSSMPVSALQHVEVDHQLPVAQIAEKLVQLASEPAGNAGDYPVSDELAIETKIMSGGRALESGALELGQFSPFTCPECHGTLMQIRNGSLMRFRCHTGHAYTQNTLLATLDESSEDALWNALRALEEGVMLLAHLSEHARQANQPQLAASLTREADEVRKRADGVKQVFADFRSWNETVQDTDNPDENARHSRRPPP